MEKKKLPHLKANEWRGMARPQDTTPPRPRPQGSVRSANAEQGGTLTTSPYVGLSRIQAVMRCRLVVNPGSVVVHSPEAHKTGGRAIRRVATFMRVVDPDRRPGRA